MNRWKTNCLGCVLIALSGAVHAQVVAGIYDFGATGSSQNPAYVTPVQGRDGELYGTTYGVTYGSVFKITTAGSGGDLYEFNSSQGANPVGGLTLSADGSFYGTTAFGGSTNQGVLFKITASGTYTVLHEFAGGSDGANPFAPPILASDGNLYGTTEGLFSVASTIYKYTPSGTFSTIYQFEQVNGATISAPLTQGSNGDLFGSASGGGVYGCGTLFTITRSGTLVSSYSFPCGSRGALPGTLVQASDGNFYGMTDQGGTENLGTIFKMNPLTMKVTTLHKFVGGNGDGKLPTGGLVEATDGNLYGETSGGGSSNDGVLFRLTTTGDYKVIYTFQSTTGSGALAAPFQHTNGLLYGTLQLGGTFGKGAVYSLDLGLKPFVTFVRPTGKVGVSAQILGQGLTGATSVTFNGVAATFSVVSDTYMTAVVPAGATTGAVVVATPAGNLTSNVSFRISK
jgi:uncharacterized repeat protein (TIGR03803 family)